MADACVAFDVDIAARPVVGLIAIALVPVFVMCRDERLSELSAPERAFYSVGATVLGTMSIALAINTVLPWFGKDDPLSAGAVGLTWAMVNTALVAWRWRSITATSPSAVVRWLVRPLQVHHIPVLVAAAALMLAVMGAVRLNNGASGAVAYAGLLVGAVALIAALCDRRAIDGHGNVDAIVVYLAGLALLVGTSLRFWYIAGHDIQREFYVFTLTHEELRWEPSALVDSYNACLSVTILPSILTTVTGLSGVAVFKVLMPLIFAVVPVAVYVLGRRMLSRPLALLGAMLFISFPTFWADMPFLARQEIAFLFAAGMVLAATQPSWRHRTRLMATAAMGIGLVFSHYSSTYITLIACIAGAAGLVLVRWWQRRRGVARRGAQERVVLLSWPIIGVLAAGAFMWSGPVTHTGAHAEDVVADAIAALAGDQARGSSGDLRYLLLPKAATSPQNRLDSYTNHLIEQAEPWRERGWLVPVPIEEQRVTAIRESSEPPTALGSWLNKVTALDVGAVNGLIRNFAAKLLQVLLLVGLAVVLMRKQFASGLSADLQFFAAGSVAPLMVLAVIPGLSGEYGLLRAFLQALLVLAPVVSLGCWVISRPLARRSLRAAYVATGLTGLFIFAVTTGIVPHALGAYSPQLSLANSGAYYDLYSRSSQDVEATSWVIHQARQAERDGEVLPISADLLDAQALQAQRRSLKGVDDQIHPAVLRKDATVFLTSPAVSDEPRSWVFIDGDVVFYRYPEDVLDQHKSLIFDNGRARVYR